MSDTHSSITVAVIGAGTMGQGIAQLALQAGHSVILIDQAQEQLTQAQDKLTKLFERFAAKGKITVEQQNQRNSALHCTTQIEDAAESGLVIEAIVERMDIKQSVFTTLEKIVSANTLLASNTSSLSITAIASALEKPERFLGLHFFNPPGIMPLVEVVAATQTHETTLTKAMQLMTEWGKKPVRCKDTPSFIVNRVARPFYVESFRLLEENALSPKQLDACLRSGLQFKMGPCELTDFIGQDVNYAVSQSLWQELGYPPHLQPSFIQGNLVAANYLGRKSGRGFYDYSEDIDNTPLPNQTKTVAFSSLHKNNDCLGTLDNGVTVYRCDGRRAANLEQQYAKPIAVIDITTTNNPDCLAISYSPKAKQLMGDKVPALDSGLAQHWAVMPDRPGLVNLRVVSLIINEAATAALLGIADEAGIDSALQGGVNYPQGAFSWGNQIHWDKVSSCLQTLANYYGPAKYTVSPYIQDKLET